MSHDPRMSLTLAHMRAAYHRPGWKMVPWENEQPPGKSYSEIPYGGFAERIGGVWMVWWSPHIDIDDGDHRYQDCDDA